MESTDVTAIKQLCVDMYDALGYLSQSMDRQEFLARARSAVDLANKRLDQGLNPKGSSLLFAACRSQDMTLIRRLVELEGGNISHLEKNHKQFCLDEFMYTFSKPEDIQYLIDAGATMVCVNGRHSFNFGVHLANHPILNYEDLFDLAIENGLNLAEGWGTSPSAYRMILTRANAPKLEHLTFRGVHLQMDQKELATLVNLLKIEYPDAYQAYESGVMKHASSTAAREAALESPIVGKRRLRI